MLSLPVFAIWIALGKLKPVTQRMQIKSPVNMKRSGEFFFVLFKSKKPFADQQSENHTREVILGNEIFSAIFGED